MREKSIPCNMKIKFVATTLYCRYLRSACMQHVAATNVTLKIVVKNRPV